jgi:hypothetical protein
VLFNASYLQNSLHSMLETIAEESSANATTYGAAPVEYPPNMMFYAEYPGGTLTPTLSSGNHSSHTNKVLRKLQLLQQPRMGSQVKPIV